MTHDEMVIAFANSRALRRAWMAAIRLAEANGLQNPDRLFLEAFSELRANEYQPADGPPFDAATATGMYDRDC